MNQGYINCLRVNQGVHRYNEKLGWLTSAWFHLLQSANETGMSRPDTLQSVSRTTLRKYSANFRSHMVSDLQWGFSSLCFLRPKREAMAVHV